VDVLEEYLSSATPSGIKREWCVCMKENNDNDGKVCDKHIMFFGTNCLLFCTKLTYTINLNRTRPKSPPNFCLLKRLVMLLVEFFFKLISFYSKTHTKVGPALNYSCHFYLLKNDRVSNRFQSSLRIRIRRFKLLVCIQNITKYITNTAMLFMTPFHY
jgi:hypothetical protein